MRNDALPLLPEVMPDWLRGHPASTEQLGGLSRNVWLWSRNIVSCSSASMAISGEASTSNTNIPGRIVLKFLELDHHGYAWHSWAVQKSWGEAQYAPRVVGEA